MKESLGKQGTHISFLYSFSDNIISYFPYITYSSVRPLNVYVTANKTSDTVIRYLSHRVI